MRTSIGRIMKRAMWLCFVVGAPAALHATSLTIAPISPPVLTAGQALVVTVGIDGVNELQGYTMDVEYDASELVFVNATQLGASEDASQAGQYAQAAFFLDPSADLAGGGTGRASVVLPVTVAGGVQEKSSILFVDGRTNDPVPGPAGLLRLEFRATADVASDALPDVTVGLLDATADDLTASFRNGGSSVGLVSDRVSVSVVPEPGGMLSLSVGFLALGLLSTRTKGRQPVE